jgi:hypothetical protein
MRTPLIVTGLALCAAIGLLVLVRWSRPAVRLA